MTTGVTRAKKLRVAGLAVLIACAAVFSGCAAVPQTSEYDALMVDVFNAFENEQYDFIVDNSSDEMIFAEGFEQGVVWISEYIEGTVKSYEKTSIYCNTSIDDGVKTVTLDLGYNVKTSQDEYAVNMTLLQTGETEWKIYGFHLVRASEMAGNGAIIDFNNFDIVQLLLLVYSAACLGLTAYAVVVCAKAQIRKKALWIVMILLLYIGISLTLADSRNNISIQLLNVNISYLQKFNNGDIVLSVLVPLGAILFLCMKKSLVASAAKYREQQWMASQQAINAGGQPEVLPGTDLPETAADAVPEPAGSDTEDNQNGD